MTNDVATLARIVRDESPDTLVLVDAVSALGGMPVETDAWGLDVCLASVQKGLALPPGITVVAVSEAALRRAAKHPYRGTYFDFLAYKQAADADGVPSTPSIPHFYALEKQLDHILRKETLPARFERHRRMRDRTIERTASFAELASDRDHASVTVTALRPSIDAETIRDRMRERGYTIGGGYGDWKGATFRIGHMGDIPMESLEAMLNDLEEIGRGSPCIGFSSPTRLPTQGWRFFAQPKTWSSTITRASRGKIFWPRSRKRTLSSRAAGRR